MALRTTKVISYADFKFQVLCRTMYSDFSVKSPVFRRRGLGFVLPFLVLLTSLKTFMEAT